MKNYRPLLLQEIDVRLPGLHVRRLRLNRHLPEVDSLAEHNHAFAQILCYLSGGGLMVADGREYEVAPNTIVMLPPRCVHSFRETTGRRPLCLVLDLDWRGASKRGFSHARLSQSAGGGVKKELSELTKIADPGDPGCRLIVAAATLRILDTIFQSLHVLPARQRTTPAFVQQYERLLRQSETALPEVSQLAAQMGYQMDYLNRIFKQATGLTLREYRDAFFLKKAKQLLRENARVRDAGEKLGFPDQNYFSRWFKKLAGVQPRAFKDQS